MGIRYVSAGWLCLTALMTVSTVTGQAASPDSSGVRRAIEALFNAAQRKDLVALDTIYAGDRLTVIEGAGINRGWPDYRDHHLGPELKEFSDFHYQPSEIEAHVQGNIAWAIFRYTLKAKSGDRVIDQVGRGTAILERKGNRWIILHTQTGSRARRPTDPGSGFWLQD